MRNHVKILGWLFIVTSAGSLLIGLALTGFLAGIGAISGEMEAFVALTLIGGFAGAFLILISIPSLVAGIGLLKGWGWARIFAIVIAVLNLPNFPIGTALGVYALWVLFQDETKRLFSSPRGALA